MNKSENIINSSDTIKLSLYVFCVICLVFLPYQIGFFIGNHDWDWVKGTTQILQWDTGLFEGRYGKFLLNVLLFGGQVLPLLNVWCSFAFLTFGGILLVDYWRIKDFSSRLLVALLPILSPFILGWLYFPINILGNFMAVPLVVGGLILAEMDGKLSKTESVFFFLLALGVYPSVAEMMIVCFGIRCIINPPHLYEKTFLSALTIVSSLVIFKIILSALTAAGIIYTGHYNMQMAGGTELLQRLPEMAKMAVKQLWITVPFIPLSLKICGIGIILSAIAVSLKKTSSLLMAALIWLAALGATVLSAYLAKNSAEVAYMPRIDFYGLNFLYAGAAAVLLQTSGFFRNFGILAICIYLFLSVNEDFSAQKAWQMGKAAEEMLVERISQRIENRAQGISSPLIPVIAGELPLRPRYYNGNYRVKSPYVLNAPFIVRHIPSGMFNFYAVSPVFASWSGIRQISPDMHMFFNNAAHPWPAEGALFVDDEYAIILLTSDGMKAIKAQLPK